MEIPYVDVHMRGVIVYETWVDWLRQTSRHTEEQLDKMKIDD